MNITLIDIGAVANDGTGDDIRTAFIKVNENFVELETSIDASTVAANLGSGQGIFKEKVENELRFRSIDVGDRLSITTDGDRIVINTDFLDRHIQVGSIETEGAAIIGTYVEAGQFRGHVLGNVVGSVYPPEPDYIIGRGNIIGVNAEVGELDPDYQPARVDGIAVKDLNSTINNFDFGNLDKVYTSAFGYLLDQVGIDLGTFISPASFDIELGTL